MRILLAVAAVLSIAQFGFAQGRGGRGGRGGGEAMAPPTSGFECFENVVTPDYPRAARQNLMTGTMYVTLQVTPQGTAEKLNVVPVSAWSDAPKILVPPVEKAVQSSKLKASCAGKTVAVAFRYEVYGERMANPQVTTKTEGPVMYIQSQPETAAGK